MELFEPGRIGKLQIKNRIVMAAMGIAGLAEPDGGISSRVMTISLMSPRNFTTPSMGDRKILHRRTLIFSWR